jgi:hypothetical protein
MGKSFRIRTTPGEDKNIVIQVDQDFEQLEILSLKIRQQDVYDRMCADYGVVAGRIFSNNGYGIPNAKVSIFVPVSDEDAQNPIISSIYPYKTLEQTNEDGYRFNLLPYLPSYPGHVPTGTFPSRLDSVVNQTAIEIYDKYYKYTVTTNESGDYMIFNVPVGDQTIVMNVDLSDIGPFSLSPQDLIRMGMATEEQFDGVKFRSSPNFYELPQIIVINKTIDIVPFWGEPEICRIGITRTDFDLSAEANINIQPTAIFMGSIMSTNEKASLRANGAAQKSTGELCRLITGPGEILGISQTIFQDENGLPVLRRAQLPNGGKLIDANGTWLFEVPMNRDYVFTNEFGQQVLSDDPNIGIPTRAKLRFKIKWQQSKNLNEDYKVGYYLVPNIRERGWGVGVDPTIIPGTPQWTDFQRSYGFSLDWSGYTSGNVGLTNRDIRVAIDCEDTFYEFEYNKVYTVAGLVDNYKITQASSSIIQNLFFNVNHRERFVGIKNIEDDTCQDTTNRYPVNDGVFRATLIWRIFDFLLIIVGILGLFILIVYSIVAYIWNFLRDPLLALLIAWCVYQALSAALGAIFAAVPSVGLGAVIWWAGVVWNILVGLFWLALGYLIYETFKKLEDFRFGPIRLPMLTYPDCDSCDCNGGSETGGSTLGGQTEPSTSVSKPTGGGMLVPEKSLLQFLEDTEISQPYFSGFTGCTTWNSDDWYQIIPLIEGIDANARRRKMGYRVSPKVIQKGDTINNGTINSNSQIFYYNNNLPLGETINLYNLKANYYYNQKNSCNSIGVRVEPNLNSNGFVHTDNVLVFISDLKSDFIKSGSMMTFVDPKLSQDKNDILKPTLTLSGITGTTNVLSQVSIKFADPQAPNQGNFQTLYQIPSTATTNSSKYIYKSDIEYYQVITAYTYSDFLKLVPNGASTTSLGYILASGGTKITKIEKLTSGCDCTSPGFTSGFTYCSTASNGTGFTQVSVFEKWGENVANIPYNLHIPPDSYVIFLMRGVDPYSPKYEMEISLDRLLGYNTNYLNGAQSWTHKIRTNLRLNIPIQNPDDINNVYDLLPVHNNIPSNGLIDTSSDQYLFYPSYFFTPGTDFTPFNTTLHKFYSALDFTKANYLVKKDDTQTKLSDYAIFSNFYNSNDSFVSNSVNCTGNTQPVKNAFWENNPNNTYDKYNNQDSVAGGSLMFKGIFDVERDCFVVHPSYKCCGPTGTTTAGTGAVTACTVPIYLNADQAKDKCKGGWQDSLYFSFIYETGTTLNFNDPNRIVMRTDRLPSSSTLGGFSTGTTAPIGSGVYDGVNTTLFQQNSEFAFYLISDSGILSIGGGIPNTQYGAGGTISGSNQFYGSVFSTFDCDGMVELECYENSGLNFNVKPGCSTGDIVENGCYVFVKEPLTGLFRPKGNTDLDNWSEYIMRYRFFYGLCQGVFSTVFINNWVNGNLFTFSFKVDTFYNSLNEVSNRVYPKDVIILQEDSNNFYYRSTPTTYSSPSSITPIFLGSTGGTENNGQNAMNLKYPTTILNMGPRDDIQKFLNLNSNYDGFYLNQVPQTTYSDLSDMINFFSIIRMLDFTFWGGIVGRNLLTKLFNNRGDFKNSAKVDADFAQSASVNSELGVIPFDSEYYASSGPNPSLISAEGYQEPGEPAPERMMGVYYYSPLDDIQLRDLVSPMRIIRYKNSQPNNFQYQNLSKRSQIIPNYKWRLDSGGSTIFGTQRNNWATNSSIIRRGYRYQDLDRKSSGYYSDGDLTNDTFYRGYIHAYEFGPKTQTSNTPPMLIFGNSYTILEHQPGDSFINVGAPNNNPGTTFIYNGNLPTWNNGSKLFYEGKFLYNPKQPTPAFLVGAPWHFYFGVRKGATAINRFFTKYLGIEELNEQ